jgi:hypothetical protein
MRALTAALLLAAACASTTEAPDTLPPDRLRVLFLGNSLTFANDLPALLRRLGAVDGITIETRDESRPNYALEDHWNRQASRDALADGRWDVVVMQQGPSSLATSRAQLVQWARTWADAIRAAGGRPALYMVWPDTTRFAFFDDVALSYRTAAESSGSALYPAGEAWQAAWARDPRLPLYGSDGFHPSVAGTYLAALVIYRGMTGRAPPHLDGVVSPSVDSVLHAAAATTGPQPFRVTPPAVRPSRTPPPPPDTRSPPASRR